MTMKRCKADLHFFNTDKHESCPYCQNKDTNNKGHTIQKSVDQEETAFTKIRISPSRDQEETAFTQKPPDPVDDQGETEFTQKSISPELSSNVTIGLFKTEKEFSPVVGWLVCLEGTEKGKDYRIKPGINEVGRDDVPDVDIVIKGDESISRRDHAEIEYDPEENLFFLIRKKNQAVKLNKLKVRQPVQLNPYDIIQFGKSKFIFSPLCSDKFKWPLD